MRDDRRGVRSLILASPLVTTVQWEHDADSLITALPGSEFVMIPGSGHLTMHDNPDAMLAAVRTFLARSIVASQSL